jgi:hypothetical protein
LKKWPKNKTKNSNNNNKINNNPRFDYKSELPRISCDSSDSSQYLTESINNSYFSKKERDIEFTIAKNNKKLKRMICETCIQPHRPLPCPHIICKLCGDMDKHFTKDCIEAKGSACYMMRDSKYHYPLAKVSIATT